MPIEDQLIVINDHSTNDNDCIDAYSSSAKNGMATNDLRVKDDVFVIHIFVVDKSEMNDKCECESSNAATLCKKCKKLSLSEDDITDEDNALAKRQANAIFILLRYILSLKKLFYPK